MKPSDYDNLELKFKVPTVMHDAQVTLINNAIDGISVINFVQNRPPKDGKPRADVVASVSFSNIVAFKKFVTDMQANLKKHEQRNK